MKKKKKKKLKPVNYEKEIKESLRHIDIIRNIWSFKDDPGPGLYVFGDKYQLKILEREGLKKGKSSFVRTYIVELIDRPGYPITLSFEWESFCNNLRNREISLKADKRDINMTRLSIHDDDLRERIRLKAKNDYDIDLNEDQISMCIIEMDEQRLSLFRDQIWPNKRKWKKKEGKSEQWMERITWDKTIDGYRAVAHRSGRFAGVDAPAFETDADGQLIARITVYALDSTGVRRGYVGEARFNEFVQLVDEWSGNNKTGNKIPNSQWSEKPFNQIAVAAERQALRKAFQDLDGDVAEIVYSPEPELELPRDSHDPEPDLETSKGSETGSVNKGKSSRPRADDSNKPERAPASESPDSKHEMPDASEKPKGKYVGIPKDGFKIFKMYNSDERIVMYGSKNGICHIALDSGFKVLVDGSGYEIERLERTDTFKGGRKWEKGDSYYDGSVIEATADNKKAERSIWLALDNGFKVCLDQWGKQVKKKERKEKQKKEPDNVNHSDSKPEPLDAMPVDQVPPGTEDVESVDAKDGQEIDIELIDSVEMMRKVTTPLLKRWCHEIARRQMDPKSAYKELTGVILNKGQAMTLDDYKALHTCLEEALSGDR